MTLKENSLPIFDEVDFDETAQKHLLLHMTILQSQIDFMFMTKNVYDLVPHVEN